MNRSLVDRIADAVLYEGYILYPYRPSLKNRQRWTFGGLFPDAYCRIGSGDSSNLQTECLIQGDNQTTVEAVVRFLQLTERMPAEVEKGLRGLPPPESVSNTFFRRVETLQVDGRMFPSWQEAEKREVSVSESTIGELLVRARVVPFAFPGGRSMEPVRDRDGGIAGVLVREQQALAGSIEVRAVEASPGLYRLMVRVVNNTPLPASGTISRDAALLCSLASTHIILAVQSGAFVSLIDPPDRWRDAAAACRNVGVWPVLVGSEGQNDTMLASPIILYDHPQVAPESPGDFFDGTEIDEMLTLRILTMTDEEKRAMAAVDERARDLLARTEALAREQLLGLHGTIRTTEERAHG